MEHLSDDQRITLTFGQLKRLVNEGLEEKFVRQTHDDTHLIDDEFEVNEDGVLLDYHGNKKNVVIPSGIKGIDGAFKNDDNIVSITIPYGVKFIGMESFQNCSNLKSVTLPGTLRYIDSYAFENCESLTYIEIPKNTEYVGNGAFSGCDNLRQATVQLSTKLYDDSFPKHTIQEEF